MTMYNPPHPGEVLKGLWLEPMGMTVTEAAKKLGVARKTVSKIINGHGAIEPEMAFRLEIVFGPRAETWLNMQTAYDLWQKRALKKSLKETLKATRAA